MLQKLNERISGVFAWVIIILIAITFTLFGVDYYLQSNKASQAKAEVNGSVITQEQYELTYRRLKNQQDPSTLTSDKEKELKEQALKQLIINDVTKQSAISSGFYVGAEQAQNAILQIPQFQDDGKFSQARYQQTLHSALFTPQSFLQQVEQGMLINQQRFAYVGSAFALESEVKQFVKLYYQKRSFDTLTIKSSDVKNDIKVSNAKVQEYYQAHQKSFMTQEKVAIEYIKLSMKDILQNIHVEEQEIKTYYEDNIDTYRTPTQWKIAHILFTFDEKNKEEILKKAQKVEKQLKNNPQDFAKLAKQYSSDKISLLDGGELPWITAGQQVDMDKELIKLKKGQISSVFKTSYGLEIVKLIAIKTSTVKAFDKVKASIEKQIKVDEAQRAFSKDNETLTDMSYQNPDSLEPVAKKLNLKIENSALFSRQGGDNNITKNKFVIAAAFSNEVLAQGNNSEPLQLDNDSLIVLRVKQHELSKPIAFDNVKIKIQQLLENHEIARLTKEKGQALLSLLKENKLTKDILSKNGLKWQTNVGATRDDNKVNHAVTGLAFELPKPTKQIAQPTLGQPLDNDDYVIVRLNKVTPGNLSSISKEQRSMIKQQIETNYGLKEYELMLASLMKNAKVINH
jgi:peptidyl-prolyl cis-trans isomerase D